MKNTKARENETITKFNDFVSKINKGNKMEKKESSGLADLPTDQKWLTKPLQFAVTSDKAFEVQKAKEYEETIGTGKNFENFAT